MQAENQILEVNGSQPATLDANLFSELAIRGITFRNRIAVSPMCQYSCEDGFATDWHLVHLGSRAVGGAGLVIVEATAVEARGRISPGDMGIWKDEQIAPLARIADFVKSQGAVAGIQLAHAGRKASSRVPWDHNGSFLPASQGGWTPVAPIAEPFREADPAPHALTIPEIQDIVHAFVDAAKRALRAGFQVIELHGAHGYLINEFLSPLVNKRVDEFGGSFENRTRFPLEVARAVRAVWPEHLPLFMRISASDWAPGGWTVEDSVELARLLKNTGVDLIDCSSGGAVASTRIQVGPGYQVPFAEQVRQGAKIPTAAVGMITEPAQANAIVKDGKADLILLAREYLREPYWVFRAAQELGLKPAVPIQYTRAF